MWQLWSQILPPLQGLLSLMFSEVIVVCLLTSELSLQSLYLVVYLVATVVSASLC